MSHPKHIAYDSNVKSDIELLGNILGQVIKEQSGQENFNLVEKIRLTSIIILQGIKTVYFKG